MAHDPGVEDLGFARLDLDRLARTGAPEVVLAAHKTPEQTLTALTHLAAAHPDRPVLATRCPVEVLTAARELGGARIDELAGTVVLGPELALTGRVAVVAAGTSDLPVAREATTGLEVHGVAPDLIVDVGVAGLHRLLAERDRIVDADAVIAVAGMDGALPGVVAGLVACPVVAVPTSVGYGASFGGVAALLTMLNACAPGVTVVNIDNGFGAAAAVARMLRPRP
ncbi:nickel pincer cofactor biosynthesis protein LarB [uncultured Jatrophihabitans sp.]|uniref:nickel pincer cofactor biosynthesis protein LarB n=1 Tax=uncultured Jatrophihabitans sp. TaxID=1610747 RepID=UPI0035CBD0B5